MLNLLSTLVTTSRARWPMILRDWPVCYLVYEPTPEGLLEESGVEKESTDFRLTTVNHEGKEYGRRASLKIEALDGKTKFTLDQVLTTERLPIGEKHFTNNRELRKWPHLDGIYLPQVDERKVSILIGSNRPDIIDNNSEIRRRTKGQSYAVNTPLG